MGLLAVFLLGCTSSAAPSELDMMCDLVAQTPEDPMADDDASLVARHGVSIVWVERVEAIAALLTSAAAAEVEESGGDLFTLSDDDNYMLAQELRLELASLRYERAEVRFARVQELCE